MLKITTFFSLLSIINCYSLNGKPSTWRFLGSTPPVKEFDPLGVHVAHVIIDGGINGEVIRARAPGRITSAGKNGTLLPRAIADNYWLIHLQHRSTWTFEMDLRPYKEVF